MISSKVESCFPLYVSGYRINPQNFICDCGYADEAKSKYAEKGRDGSAEDVHDEDYDTQRSKPGVCAQVPQIDGDFEELNSDLTTITVRKSNFRSFDLHFAIRRSRSRRPASDRGRTGIRTRSCI